MADANAPTGRKPIRGPNLLIITGSSHVGKTTVARAVIAELGGEAAYLGVDDILGHTLPALADEIWTQIPLAYDLIEAEVGVLLNHGWTVIVESTFTFVAQDGSAEFHDATLKRLIELASVREVPSFVAQLTAPPDVIVQRSQQSQRLPEAVVTATSELHEDADLPQQTIVIDSERRSPAQAAATIVAALVQPSP